MADSRWILLAASLFTACSQDNMGGGTELPSPITVVFTSSDTSSTALVARQARIWSVDSTTSDSVRLTSRGILLDSSNVVQLPPDSGTFLLEAWIGDIPPESLSLQASVPKSLFPDSCTQSLGRSTGLQGVKSCGDTSASPSRQSGGSSPNLVALVHISGSATHPFRVKLTDTSVASLGKVRLWSLGTSDSLVFRGQLGVSGDSIGRLPTLTQQQKYVIEIWAPGNSAPGRIAVRRPSSLTSTAWSACPGSTLGSLGPSTLSLFSCSLSPEPFPEDGADIWSAIEFWP